MPQFESEMSTVNASKGQEFTGQFGQVPQTPVGSDKESSIIDASKSNLCMLGVEPEKSSVQLGMTTVVGKQSCGQPGQLFTYKIHQDIHIQEEHMARLPSHMSTDDAGKGDYLRRTHLVQHQAPVRTDNESSIIDATNMNQSVPGVEPMQSTF